MIDNLPDGKRETRSLPSFEMSTLASLCILHSETTIFLSARNKKIIKSNKGILDNRYDENYQDNIMLFGNNEEIFSSSKTNNFFCETYLFILKIKNNSTIILRKHFNL